MIKHKKNITENFKELEESILFYPGSLRINGITSSFIQAIKLLIKSGKKIYIWNNTNHIKKSDFSKFLKYFENFDLNIITTNYNKPKGLMNKISLWIYKSNQFSRFSFIFKKRIDRIFREEALNFFSNTKFSIFVNYSGYESIVNGISKFIVADNKFIYVHNNMHLEYKYRKNFTKFTVFNSYDYFDKIIFVSKSLLSESLKFKKPFKNMENKCFVLPNLINEYDSEEKRQLEDPENIAKISKILNNSSTRIATIGRNSIEKDLLLTIKTFAKYNEKFNRNSILIVISSASGSRKRMNFIYNLKLNIILKKNSLKDKIIKLNNIKDIDKLLKIIDLVILTPLYEGQGLAAIESSASNTPTVVTPIPQFIEINNNYSNLYISKDRSPHTLSSLINFSINKPKKFPIAKYNDEVAQILKEIYGVK